MMKGPLTILLLLCAVAYALAEESLLIADFEQGLGPEWRVNIFKGETD